MKRKEGFFSCDLVQKKKSCLRCEELRGEELESI